MNRFTPRDEREVGVDLAADRLAVMVLSYGLLVIVAVRGVILHESSWDLLGLLVLSGVVGFAYRARKGAATRPWNLAIIAATLIAAIVAIVLVAQLPR
jgi:hypothetical protein